MGSPQTRLHSHHSHCIMVTGRLLVAQLPPPRRGRASVEHKSPSRGCTVFRCRLMKGLKGLVLWQLGADLVPNPAPEFLVEY